MDETCYFLAIDFDGEEWAQDIAVLQEVCLEFHIPLAVERSRSGQGAHAWFFFQSPLSASLARKFGSALLTCAMNKRHEVKFQSYDRLFPNQDTLPKGGLGNLIALPLQKAARKNNNSEFIDESGKAFEDQWAFLSAIKKLSPDEIEKFTASLSRGNELGQLKRATEEDQEEKKPWDASRVKLRKSDFPQALEIVKANMLFVPKAGLSQRAMNHLNRLAAFQNPEFYKAQAMRLSVAKIPRIISCSEETSEYLCLPRGCENDLKEMGKELGIDVHLRDETNQGININVEFIGSLRDEQPQALEKLLEYDNGILCGTTAFGKTVVAIKLIAERKVNTLILVDRVSLVTQWKNRLEEFLKIDHYILPRFTSFRVPLDKEENNVSIQELYSEIVVNELRNQRIVADVVTCYEKGRNCVILTERTAHFELLAKKLSERIPSVVRLRGGLGGKETREMLERIAETPSDKNIVIVATGRYIGEGFDEPRLDTLFLAMPISWKGTLQQYAGRLHRLFENKSEVQIYDYVDIHVGMLEKMYHKRLNGYAAIGYKAKGERAAIESPDIIFDKSNFLPVYMKDIVNASREILIVSPFVTKRRSLQMLQNLAVAIENNVKVIVVTRPAEDFKDRDTVALQSVLDSLKGAGIRIVYKSKIHQKFALIDQSIVWYGSINLLSFSTAEESIMRLESPNIANELIKSIDIKK